MELERIIRGLPTFKNHNEARQWFRRKFQENFLIRCSDNFHGKKIYCYHIVENKELYQSYMLSFAKYTRPIITNMDTFESYSTVEISENGEVAIYI